jgi:hypothetical protein
MPEPGSKSFLVSAAAMLTLGSLASLHGWLSINPWEAGLGWLLLVLGGASFLLWLIPELF